MTDETERSDAEKIRTLITGSPLNAFTSNDLASMLVEGDAEYGIEPIQDQAAKDAVLNWRMNDWSDGRTAESWSKHDGILSRLEQLAVASEQHAIEHPSGGVGAYLRRLEDSIERLPAWLRVDLVQWERDFAEDAAFEAPEDWQRLIGVLQIESEYNAFPDGRTAVDNYGGRKTAWDEYLKFTIYRVTIDYTLDGESQSTSEELFTQSSADAQNLVLRRLPEDATFESAAVKPTERASPGIVQDPLNDLEDFVYYA